MFCERVFSARLFVKKDLFRKNICRRNILTYFFGHLNVNFVVTVFDPNNSVLRTDLGKQRINIQGKDGTVPWKVTTD